jgi:ribonuclease PH
MRTDRPADQLRPLRITRRFTETAAGSVLWQQGKTIVLCTASVENAVPKWFGAKNVGGWLTADYVMLPASTPQRKSWPQFGHTDSRGTEIQRLIGRSLRAAIDLSKIGPHTIHIDCQVLQADGGTRTASICGGFVALRDAVASLPKALSKRPGGVDTGPTPTELAYDPAGAIVNEVAAVSVGMVDGTVLLDLEYVDDVAADVDLNVAMTAKGKYVEVQGCSEHGDGLAHEDFLKMLESARAGCQTLLGLMRSA